MPADPFARSAISSQRSLLAAQFSRSAVFVIPSKPGRAPGGGPGTPMKGPPGPREGGAFGALGAHGGHWDDSEAIPNGVLYLIP